MCDLRVIIDNGSGSIKAGISGQQKPRAVFPSIVGSEKNNETTKYVGDIVESMNCKLICIIKGFEWYVTLSYTLMCYIHYINL